MKEMKLGFAEVVFPLVPLVVGAHFQSAAFVVAALLTCVFLYSTAYYVVGSDENYETFTPLFPLVGAVGVALFFYQITNATMLQNVLVLTAFAANYLVTLSLAVRMLRKANNEFAADILGVLMSIAGLLVAAVLLWKGMEAAAILALVVTTFALPYPPKRERGDESGGDNKETNERV
jgi:uncharacterized membrane protein HdeD (DUF308 family)